MFYRFLVWKIKNIKRNSLFSQSRWVIYESTSQNFEINYGWSTDSTYATVKSPAEIVAQWSNTTLNPDELMIRVILEVDEK